jgi:AcrR family transcriptional regulator
MAGDKRTEIIEAGRVLFAAKPFQDVGTRDICARAGIVNSSLFYVFPNKVALATALYQTACQHRDEVVKAALADWPDDPRSAIQAAVTALVRFIGSDQLEACLLRRLGDAVSADPRFVNDRDGLVGLVGVLTPWMRPRQAVDQIMPVAPSVVAALLWGAARAWAAFPARPNGATTEEESAELAEQVWQALRPPVAAPSHRRKTRSPPSSTLSVEPGLFDDAARAIV